MTLAIAHKRDDLGILDVIRERRAPFSPEACVAEFADLLKQYRVSKVTGDRYSGEWCREAFRRYGLTYDPASAPKSDLYRDLLPRPKNEQHSPLQWAVIGALSSRLGTIFATKRWSEG